MLVRYAHSYIGLGITPTVALKLDDSGKGSIREIVAAISAFLRFRPFDIDDDQGRRRRLDNLIFANIAQMAKYATLSADGRPDDGLFEVITLPHHHKLRLLLTALTGITRGLGPQPQTGEYEFTTVDEIPVQMDGEVRTLPGNCRVTVRIAPKALSTIS